MNPGGRLPSKRLVALGLVFAMGVAAHTMGKLNASRKQIVPLTLTQTSLQHGETTGDEATRDVDHLVQKVVAIRSDGSTVQVTTFPDDEGRLVEVRYIVDYEKGRRIVLENSTMSMMSVPLSAQGQDARTNIGAAKSCEGIEVDSTILGYSVIRRTVDQGKRRYVNHYAPDLGCLPLEMRVFQLVDESDNSYRLIQEDRARSVVLGEPNEDLFLAGDGYVERSPASLVIELGGGTERVDAKRVYADPFVEKAEESYEFLRATGLSPADSN